MMQVLKVFSLASVTMISTLVAMTSEIATAGSSQLPLVIGANVNETEFAAFARDHQRDTLSESLEALRPGPTPEARLMSKLERAQKAWLSDSMATAREGFREIIEMSQTADWRDSQRDVLLYAHLRVAQVTESALDREDVIARAARLFPDVEPDATLFPPPLLSELREAQARSRAQAVPLSLADVFPGFRFTLVDGKKVDLSVRATYRMTAGLHRITALSDRFAPLHLTMSAAQLGVFRANVEPIHRLKCGVGPKTMMLEDGVSVEIFDGLQCSRIDDIVPLPSGKTLSWSEPAHESKFRSRRDWIWLGVGAAVAASAYAIYRANQPRSADPAHRDGF